MGKEPLVVGIGELLWDVFPEGKKLGGAPLNFTYHCVQLGAQGQAVSALGADADGEEIRRILESKNLPDTYVQADPDHPTGRVNVTLEAGKPSYEICRDVAWDHIRLEENLRVLATRADAVGFGSLAQRSPLSRATIHAFLEAMRPEALRIFDVNLRQNFFSKEILTASLQRANVLKLSDEELPTLANDFGLTGDPIDQLHALRQMFDLRLVAFTRGGEGSVLVTAEETSDHPGLPTTVQDTVGAGDSFTATLCIGLLKKRALGEINQKASQVAAFVCSQAGATPLLQREHLYHES
jgi:fructokinase